MSFFDVFDENFDSKNFAVFSQSSRVKIDYIVKEKSNITLNKREKDIEINDFLVERSTKQIWRVNDVKDDTKLIIYSNFDAIDFPYFVEGATITSADLEDAIGTIISDYWTSNVDPLISLPITIFTPTVTNGSLEFFDEQELSLRQILENAISKYNIVCRVEFNGTGLDVTIENQNANLFEFRLQDTWINRFRLNVSDVKFNTLTLYAFNLSSVLVSEEYYLLTDNTVVTDETDVNRDLPVLPKIKLVDFADFNIESARQILTSQLSNNEIIVEALEDNPLEDMKIGDKVKIYDGSKIILSQFTAVNETSGAALLQYTFGIGRNRLTDKLKRSD